MQIDKAQIEEQNKSHLEGHLEELDFLQHRLEKQGLDTEAMIQKIADFQIAIPSWALGAGGTRFGRFSGGGEPGNLEQKINDVGILHSLTQSAGAISLHLPWDIPQDPKATKEQAAELGIVFDAVNSNTFQDQKGQKHSYKFGSLCHVDPLVRQQAVAHVSEVIKYGEQLGSKSITVWLADGSSFPGQLNFRNAFQHTLDALKEIYKQLPADWKIFLEYKPYEPNFYSTVVQDWGTSYLMAESLGEQAYCLVDLGHHLPNTNIEQIVATLMHKGRLGGFHFNDSKYGDDDLTTGCINPYQLYLIFNELVDGMENNDSGNPTPAWMIDASHNLKDPLEDLMQSISAIKIAYAQALIMDRKALYWTQQTNDLVACQAILQDAFRTDVRPLIREASRRRGGAIHPISLFRQQQIRTELIKMRGTEITATGL